MYRNTRRLIQTFTISVTTGAMLLLTSCEPGVKLPQGYRLVMPTSEYVVISREPDGRSIIDGNIEGYKVLGNVIVGYAGKAPPAAGPVETGYFIIDCYKVQRGLSKKEWLARLRECGIGEEPQLEKPRP